MALPTPTLTTDRLVLRGHTLEDYPRAVALWSNPDVTRHIGGRPATPAETWARLLRYVGHWALLGYGFWAIVERASGAFIGEVGFADFKRDVTPSLEGLPEMGWVVLPEHHGKGLATEAVRAALGWAGEHLPGRTIACMIDPGNEPSLRLARRMGFATWVDTTHAGSPTTLFRREPGRAP